MAAEMPLPTPPPPPLQHTHIPACPPLWVWHSPACAQVAKRLTGQPQDFSTLMAKAKRASSQNGMGSLGGSRRPTLTNGGRCPPPSHAS